MFFDPIDLSCFAPSAEQICYGKPSVVKINFNTFSNSISGECRADARRFRFFQPRTVQGTTMKKIIMAVFAASITCAVNAAPITWLTDVDYATVYAGYEFHGVLLQRMPDRDYPYANVTIDPGGNLTIINGGVLDFYELEPWYNSFSTTYDETVRQSIDDWPTWLLPDTEHDEVAGWSTPVEPGANPNDFILMYIIKHTDEDEDGNPFETVYLEFRHARTDDDRDFSVDLDFTRPPLGLTTWYSPTPVPEPAAVSLLALGCAVLGLRRRRKGA